MGEIIRKLFLTSGILSFVLFFIIGMTKDMNLSDLQIVIITIPLLFFLFCFVVFGILTIWV